MSDPKFEPKTSPSPAELQEEKISPSKSEFLKIDQVEEGIRKLLIDASPEHDRVEILRAGLLQYLDNTQPDKRARLEKIVAELQDIVDSDDEAFISAAAFRIRTFLTQEFSPSDLETMMRKAFVETSNFIPINEIFSYGVSDKSIHIHVAPTRTLPVTKSMALVRQGLRELARRVLVDSQLQNIQEVSATSWIVAEHPGIMEKMGFIIDGAISDEMRKEHFPHETRPVLHCHIDRERFLELYGDSDPQT